MVFQQPRMFRDSILGNVALAWAFGGTVIVHIAFYKLLRVPLPWGLFRPFY